MNLPVRVTDKGCLIDVRLTPGASHSCVDGLGFNSEGRVYLKVRVTAVPDKGKANVALIKLLSKALRRGKTEFEIAAGKQDRNKALLVKGDPKFIAPEIEKWLKTL